MRDGKVNIEDHLVDNNNRPIAASVNFEVRYSSPENTEGNFDSPTVSKFVQQQSLDDDQQMLLNIEQNIANLERSLNQGTSITLLFGIGFEWRWDVKALKLKRLFSCMKNLVEYKEMLLKIFAFMISDKF